MHIFGQLVLCWLAKCGSQPPRAGTTSMIIDTGNPHEALKFWHRGACRWWSPNW
jgi:hypothetical protein